MATVATMSRSAATRCPTTMRNRAFASSLPCLRSFPSALPTAAAAEKRDRVIQAAARFLREEQRLATFSLDAVAKAADVTRLTVYNQFGSRRGLLEAVFDDIARRGRLIRLNDAMAEPDPWKGLRQLIQ